MKTKNYDTITTFLSEYHNNSLMDNVNNTGNSLANQGPVSDYFFILHVKTGVNTNNDSLKEKSTRFSETIANNVMCRDTTRFKGMYIIYKYKEKDCAFSFFFIINSVNK
jgi:hypothetical protein